jgi:hypothetical protein
MKLKFPWLRKRQRSVTPPANHGVHDLSRQLYQALIDIRDNPKHARRKAKEALSGPRPWRYLYRTLLDIQSNPEKAEELAGAGVLEAQIAMKLHAALIEIRDKPKQAMELSIIAIAQGARMGTRK